MFALRNLVAGAECCCKGASAAAGCRCKMLLHGACVKVFFAGLRYTCCCKNAVSALEFACWCRFRVPLQGAVRVPFALWSLADGAAAQQGASARCLC